MAQYSFGTASGGGTDWSKYVKFNDGIKITGDTTAVGSFRTIKQINGAGYLDNVLLSCTGINSSGYIKITIDGVVILRSHINSTNTWYGIAQLKSCLQSAGSINYMGIVPTANYKVIDPIQAQTYGYIGGFAEVANLFLESPIFFNSSLLVQFESFSATSKTLEVSIKGGIKIG